MARQRWGITQLVIISNRRIMSAGESKNNIAHNIDGCICVDALAGLDAVEFQRRLCTDVLRRGLLSQKIGMVAAIHRHVHH